MSRKTCGICDHPQRAEIEKRLRDGKTQKSVCAEFGLSPSMLSRHNFKHPQLVDEYNIKEQDEPQHNKNNQPQTDETIEFIDSEYLYILKLEFMESALKKSVVELIEQGDYRSLAPVVAQFRGISKDIHQISTLYKRNSVSAVFSDHVIQMLLSTIQDEFKDDREILERISKCFLNASKNNDKSLEHGTK